MDIDLKSAGIGAGVAVVFGSMVWLGKKIFTKKPNKDKTTTSWEDLSENVKLMEEIVDSNMPASLIKEAGEEVGIKFTSECRKDMIKMVFMKGSDGVAAIKKQYEKWKNGEFSKEKTSETKENNSKVNQTENKESDSKESEE